jgi:vacuolar-type H+-ATPase subunit H
MPDQSSAANEHAILQEITAPLATLPDDPVPLVADVNFPLALRGYDRLAVDAYVKKTSQLVAELQATRSPEAAIRRALERVGEQISGILQRAHDTAEEITTQSRREAEDRLGVARREAAAIVSNAEQRVKDLDADTDRIWAERHRIVGDARGLAQELLALAENAGETFPAAEDAVVVDEEAGAGAEADELGVGPVRSEPGAGAQEPGGGSVGENADVVEDETGPTERNPLVPEEDPGSDVTAVMPPLHPDELEPPGDEAHTRPERGGPGLEEHGGSVREHDDPDR